VSTARRAADLLSGGHAAGLSMLTTKQITAGTAKIPVGVDGEAIVMPVPVTCKVSPGALRVRVPRDRPGVSAPKPPVNWARLRHLPGTAAGTPGAT
jgi:diacylglycerol kinase family enzyme